LKDLRHSCASLLLAKGIPMKAIQEWLGHSNFSTTANIYAHLDSKSKDLSVQALSNAISIKKMKKCSLQILKNQLALSN
jgi:site-specific recombinase xerD